MTILTFSRRTVTVALLATCFAALAIAYWIGMGKPRAIGEGASDRVQCLSYAPFRKPGETPFIEETVVSEARITEDLRLLSARTGCVRTYAGSQGLDAVPRVAQALGMKVMLGVWLGRDRERNELELARGIALANQYPDTVSTLIVGNEVLLRRELPESVLASYLDRAREQTSVPITYADVWEFWMQHPSLADHVSFVTIHILPYWEDHPVGIDAAIEHIVTIGEQMRAAFKGKDIFIGETGWPSAGRTRQAAVASRVNQARFFRQFSVAAAQHGLRYNFIEGFDQPWKRRMEGAMGGHWGLFDSAGEAKFPATGPVAEDAAASVGLIGAAVGLLLFGIAAGLRGARRWHLLTAAAVGCVSGAVLVAQWRYMVVWNRDWIEWAATGFYTVLALAFTLIAARAIRLRAMHGLTMPAVPLPTARSALAEAVVPPFSSVLAQWRRGAGVLQSAPQGDLHKYLQWLGALRLVFLFGVATMGLLLVFDARYRGFPVALYSLPLMSFALLLAAGFRTSAVENEEAVLATLILACSIVFMVNEGFANLQSITFGLESILLAGAATGFRYWRVGWWEAVPQGSPDRVEQADGAGV